MRRWDAKPGCAAIMSERLKWVNWDHVSYHAKLPDGRFVYVWRGVRESAYLRGVRGGQWWYSNEGAPDERCYGPVRTMRAAQIAAMLLGPGD